MEQKVKDKWVTIRITTDMLGKLRERAVTDRRTLSSTLEIALERFLK